MRQPGVRLVSSRRRSNAAGSLLASFAEGIIADKLAIAAAITQP
jgi:hypothetical protein